MNGQENDLRGATVFRKTPCDIDTTQLPHRDVNNNEVRLDVRHVAEDRLPVRQCCGNDEFSLQNSSDNLQDCGTVVCQQNSNALQSNLLLTAPPKKWSF